MALRPPGSVDTPEGTSRSFAAPGPVLDRRRPSSSPVAPVDPITPHDPGHRMLPTESGRAMNRFPIQTAKVQRPPLPAGILRRERLLDWLDTKVHSRVVLVTAEAGYGKTTTLADWSRRTRVRTLWYRLDEDDSNWVSFLNYLVAAGREVDAGFAPNTGALLREMGTGGATRDAIVDTFLRELPMLVTAAPLAMVFDDMHLVDGSSDVRLFFRDLLARVPERLTVIVLSRRTPNLSLARLRGRGEVSELRTDDLRFDVGETEQLFRDAYHQPLEPDVLAELNRRTEGWAASLQLVQAAIRGRTTAETRAFVRSLSSAQGALYDYLAEEVVGDLVPELQQLLMRTSILQQVDVELAALVADVDAASAHRLLDSAETLGLLSGRASKGDMARYHPLVRDFLEARLRRDEGEALATALHLRVARHAEGRNWRLAAYHYDASGSYGDVLRILAQSLPAVMARGDWDLADGYLRRGPDVVRPQFSIIRSRVALGQGDSERAIRLARGAVQGSLPPADEAGYFGLANLAAVEWAVGNMSESYRLATLLASSDQSPPPLAHISRAFALLHRVSADGDLREARMSLEELAKSQRVPGQERYYAITMLNLANCLRAMGDARGCFEAAAEAVDLLTELSAGYELASAHTVRAWAHAHLGRLVDARADIRLALENRNPVAQLEIYAEAADVLGMYADPAEAQLLLEEAQLVRQASAPDSDLLALTMSQNLLRLGEVQRAATLHKSVTPMMLSAEQGHAARELTVRAELAYAGGSSDAEELAQAALEFAARQGAGLFGIQAEVLRGLGGPNEVLRATVARISRTDSAYLSIGAHRLAPRLGDLDEASLSAVLDEARRRPERWRSALRLALHAPASGNQLPVGHLLDEIGTAEDIPTLRALGKRLQRKGGARLGIGLARRLAGRVLIRDLGRVSIAVGELIVPGTRIRRKALALLCFLVTMPEMSATRDQILDALWPDQEPAAALNSLNQTVYFVRRVFEPGYVEDRSPGYLHHDSDIVWLDAELVSSTSRKCRDLLRSIGSQSDLTQAQRLADLYSAMFALDFAYEDWATSYRENLHAAFLEIVERAVQEGIRTGAYLDAVAVARRGLEVDPTADQLEASLLQLYRLMGAHAAAAEQYTHYSTYLRVELDVEPPPIDEVSGI